MLILILFKYAYFELFIIKIETKNTAANVGIERGR